ncbi:MAG: hypothetical protein WC747_04300 [Candidatus Babeliales bacterium]
MTAALTNSTTHVQQEVRSRAPHAFGTLQRSVLPEVRYPVGEVSVQESYGRDVEEGTGPHTPPSDAIERWVKKKGLPGSALWPIIKTIEKRGTRAQPFFKPGWEASQSYIGEQFDKVMDKLMSALMGRR